MNLVTDLLTNLKLGNPEDAPKFIQHFLTHFHSPTVELLDRDSALFLYVILAITPVKVSIQHINRKHTLLCLESFQED
jgi:hypothetical protein